MADTPKALIKDAAALAAMVGIACLTIIAFAITAAHAVDWLNALSALVARMFGNG